MQILDTPFSGLLLIKPRVFNDNRGYFFESYNSQAFSKLGIDYCFEQDNQSCSNKDVIRGLHFQMPPFEQGKLIRVISGSILDIVVDLRKDQPTYGKHYKLELNATTNTMLFIPPGFAHGFRSLEDNTIFSYKCTKVYNQPSERTIRWNDPQLNIDWETNTPLLSEKDMEAPLFKNLVSPF